MRRRVAVMSSTSFIARISSPVATTMKAPCRVGPDRAESTFYFGRVREFSKARGKASTQRASRSLRDANAMQHKGQPLFHGGARDFQQLIVQGCVRLDHGIVGTDRFLKILLSLSILLEDFFPRRSDEDLAIVAKCFGSFVHVRRRWKARQTQIPKHVGNSAVEEHRPGDVLRKMVRTHLPAEHEFGKQGAVVPGQGAAADQYLMLDQSSARF